MRLVDRYAKVNYWGVKQLESYSLPFDTQRHVLSKFATMLGWLQARQFRFKDGRRLALALLRLSLGQPELGDLPPAQRKRLGRLFAHLWPYFELCPKGWAEQVGTNDV